MAKYALILLLHSGWLHLGGHDSHNLPLHFIELNHHLTQDIIDSSFVVLIDLGNSEGCDPRQDEKSHGVEPGADVGEAPEGKTKLNSVHHVLHQEQSAEFAQTTIHFFCQSCGKLRHFIAGNSHFHSCDSGQGVASWLGLLHHDHDVAVQFDTEDNGEEAEGEIGDDGYEGVVADRYERHQHGPEHRPGVDGILPVNQRAQRHLELIYFWTWLEGNGGADFLLR